MRLLDKRKNAYKFLLISLVAFNVCLIFVLLYKKVMKDSLSEFGEIVSEKKTKHIVKLDKTHLKLDTASDPNDTIIYKRIAQEIPYLPIEDLNNIDYQNRNYNESCASYPSFLDIKIHNDYWQEFLNGNLTYYIFGAYLDRRPRAFYNGLPLVKVLAMMHLLAPDDAAYPPVFCQIWYKEQPQPVLSPVKDLRRLWQYYWGHDPKYNYAHLLGCPVLEEHKSWIAQTVSLVSSPCDRATNNIKIVYEPLKENEEKKEFAVCVKGLDYPHTDMSHRLVEFMETVRSLGAEKVTMYQLQVHANTTKVLEYYERSGFLEYLPFSLSLEMSNLKEYRHMEMDKNKYSYILHEVVPYNDCLHRNMYRFKYIAVIDVDEILMPLGKFSNWHDLMQFGKRIKSEQNCKIFASFCFRCIYFPKYSKKPPFTNAIPEYFYMMQHVYRVKEHLGPEYATKCLHNTEYVIATHNHFPMHWVENVCPSYSFDPADAQLNHYREPDVKETLDDPVIDKSLWHLRDQVVERSMKVFEDLDFFDKITYDEENVLENGRGFIHL